MKKGICLLDGGSVTMQGQETDLLQNSRHFCPSIWSYTHAEIEDSSPLFLIAAIVSATQDVLNKTSHCHLKHSTTIIFEIDTSISSSPTPLIKLNMFLVDYRIMHLRNTSSCYCSVTVLPVV